MTEKNSTSIFSYNAKSSQNILNSNKKKLKVINLSDIASRDKLLNEIYKNKNLHGPIFFTETQKNIDSYKKNISRPKRIKNKYLNLRPKYFEEGNEFKEVTDFNVFKSEDEKIKDLMMQFKSRYNLNNIDKVSRRRMALNKLYEIPPEYDTLMKKARNFKSLNLEEYQQNILTSVPANSIGQEKIMDLVQKFNILKEESESVKPLPPINIRIIEDHVYNSNKPNNKSVKKMSLKKYLSQSKEPKDEFEKEERLIKNILSYKVISKFKRNKNYDFMPAYLRESLNKNLKFHL